MVKDFFGWLVAACRIWAVGSSYDNKTSRARYGLSLVCGFYIIGLTINCILLLEVKGFDNFKEVMLVVVFTSYLSSLLVLKKVYNNESAEYYIKQYEQLSDSGKLKKQSIAILFCFTGWLVLAIPFLMG